MDLTKLSDDDLMALKGGDLTKMSDAGLMSLKGAPARTGNAGLDVAGGLLRGAGSIGATLLAPFDMAARALNKGKPVNVGGYDIVGQDRRAGMDAALDSVGVDRNSLSFGAGKLGAEVAGTLGVGGGLANVAGRAMPALANAPMMTALRTSGMTTGLNPLTAGQKAADMGARMVAGGVTGASSAGLVNPEDALAGGAIGAAAPGVLKAVGYAGQMAGAAVSGTAKHALGLSTGVGAESISQAFKAGKTGSKDFVNNMRGDSPMTDVLDRAKQGLEAMRAAKSAEYRSGMIPIANDQTVLRFYGIEKALRDAVGVSTFKGQVKNEAASDVATKMREVVDEWRKLDPKQFHTPEGLDALKQKLGGIRESIPIQERTARLVADKVYNATKASIEKQAPAYANVMADYSAASTQVTEIERALSLGSKASQDTAMRKLQSLMRNNVQTNYGGRLNNAATLEAQGGVELMPSIAGQALNSWTPRSLAGQIGGGATVGAAAMTGNPAIAGMLAFQSPRLMGEMAYGAGRAAGGVSAGANLLQQQALRVSPTAGSLAQPNALAQFGYRVAPLAGSGR